MTYIDGLIDDFGIWRHTDGARILREEGYALSDAACGLVLALSLGNMEQSEVLFSYIMKSKTIDGFYESADANRNFAPKMASDEIVGQIVWAMGYALSKKFHVNEAAALITELNSYLKKTTSVRSNAYALLGAVYAGDELAKYYYDKLKTLFDNTDEDWPWPESTLDYNSGIVPYAILRYALVCGDKDVIQFGRKILLFLEERCTYGRQRGPIGSEGWLSRGVEIAPIYSQYPIDAACMLWAWLAAYQLSNDAFDKERCDAWMQWFEGTNIIRAKMYDPEDMRCFDSINSWGASYSSSAESNIHLLLSKHMSAENITI